MICDALEHLNRYRGLHRNLDTAIDYLTAYHVAHDLYDLPLGRTEVDGENVFINVMEADLSPDSNLTIHDFRITDGVSRINVIFDLVTPFGFRYKDGELALMIKNAIAEKDGRLNAVIPVLQPV